MFEYISEFEIANEIRMTRSQFKGTFLILEGKTSDVRVWNNLVDSGTCQLIPAHCKENAIQTLNILEKEEFKGMLAIIDADFMHLENIDPHNPNLFLTDTHDLETMILDSPALDKLVNEFGSESKIEKATAESETNLRGILLNLGTPLGYLRFISLREDLNLKFEGLAFSHFIDFNGLFIDELKMVREVKNKTTKQDLNEKSILEKIQILKEIPYNPWNVCCGHDITSILSLSLRRKLGTNNHMEVKPEVIEKFLRVAYEFTYFKSTNLYKNLSHWEKQNKPFKIFGAT